MFIRKTNSIPSEEASTDVEENMSALNNLEINQILKGKNQSRITKFIGRIIPAIFIYSTFIWLIYLSFFDTRKAYLFIYGLSIFSLYFSFYVALYSKNGIDKIKEHLEKTDYQEKFYSEYNINKNKLKVSCDNIRVQNYKQSQSNLSLGLNKDFQNLESARSVESSETIDFNSNILYIVIPNYHETKELISNTLNSILESKICKKQIAIFLACEEREKNAKEKADYLKNKYENSFLSFQATFHPRDLDNEIPGKGSNVHYAIKKIQQDSKQNKFEKDKILITVCDADSIFSKNHFDYINYVFSTDKFRNLKIWQAPMINLLNFAEIPIFTKAFSVMVSLHELACIGDNDCELIPFSTYSFSYNLLEQINFKWGKKIVAEDWRIFLKSYFATNHLCRVSPLYKPILCYSITADTYLDSLKERFHQAMRLSWGISEISYFLSKLIYENFCSKVKSSFNTNSNNKNIINSKNFLYVTYRNFMISFKIGKMHYFAGVFIVFSIYPIFLQYLIKQDYTPSIAPDEIEIYKSIFTFLNILNIVPLIIILKNAHELLDVINTKIVLKDYIIECIKIAIIFVPTQIIYSTIPTIWACTRLVFTDKFKFIVSSKPSFSYQRIKKITERI